MSCQFGHLEIVRFLLSEDVGADVNWLDNEGTSTLMLSAKLGAFGVVRALCEDYGADVNYSNRGDTAASLATSAGHHDIARYLTRRMG